MMELAAMEVLLLDTMEKEGEDNKLFHTWEDGTVPMPRWSDLRGVFAAAVGTMKSVAGEALTTAQLNATSEAANPTVVGFVDLNEVLFVMVFANCALPQQIIEYYTRSSCELLVSLLGYPTQKLSEWRSDAERSQDVETKLTRICQTIFRCVRRDLRWETHVQFAFDGCVPAVTYPLETLARLSAFQVIEPLPDSYEIMGFALFYRKMLVVAKTTPNILKLLSQWFLYDDFDNEAHSGDGVSILLFKWYDAHYALYGVFPAIHSLVQIRHGDLQCFYLIRHPDMTAFETYQREPSLLVSTEDMAELVGFADTRLQRHYERTLHDRLKDVAPGKPIWQCVVIDQLRQTLHGFKPSEVLASTSHSASQEIDHTTWKAMLELLVVQTSASFQRHRVFPPERQANGREAQAPKRRRWVPRVKLDFDNHDEILLRPIRPEDDAGADIASEEAQIFPPIELQVENDAVEALRKFPGGELQQEAERLRLEDGRLVWVIANYYEVFDLFAVCDAAVPIERLELAMDELLKIE